MNIEQLRIQAWARGWNDAATGKLAQRTDAGYVLGYLDYHRGK